MPVFDETAPLYNGGACFAAFDLETTGLDAERDCIVEIGAIKFDKQGVISRFSVLINPGVPMPPGASRVNNITDAMLKNKPALGAVLPDFLSFIKDTVLIAHNAPFDVGFVNAALKVRFEAAADAGPLLLGNETEGKPAALPPPALLNRLADTLVFAREAFPGLPRYNLQELAAFLKIGAQNAHRAEDDARVCMEIFARCIEKIEKCD